MNPYEVFLPDEYKDEPGIDDLIELTDEEDELEMEFLDFALTQIL